VIAAFYVLFISKIVDMEVAMVASLGVELRSRRATPDDAAPIAEIYNQGIADRVATFETAARSAEDVRAWFDGTHPIVVVEDRRDVIAFASSSSYRPRACYSGIAEFSVYVARAARGRGAGRLAMEALIAEAERAGLWKLLSRVFVENTPSRNLLGSLGFREVGVYEKHGQLDGVWRDVVIVERLLEPNISQ
jgi:phosphinothricin acetyltransferase